MTPARRPPTDPVLFGDRPVGAGCPLYVIAEIGVNFNGDLDLALRTVDAAAAAGADAVKFQTFRAEEFVADPTLAYTYRLQDGTEVTETQLEMFRRLELPAAWHAVLQDRAAARGVAFLSSAADAEAVDLLDRLGVPALKLASEDLINLDLVAHAATKGRPVILSTGMGDEGEIERALEALATHGDPEVVVLHCVSAYPTPPEACNLRRLAALRERFGWPVGFSDHTEGSEAAFLAVGLGACLIEKHFTLDRGLPGPDHRMSADPPALAELVRRVRLAETLLGSGTLTFDEVEEAGRRDFRRSIVAAVEIRPGERITADKIAYRRPGHGLKPYERDQVIGRRAARRLGPNERITLEDLEPPC